MAKLFTIDKEHKNLTLKQWKELMINEIDQVFEYQEFSDFATDKNGNEYQLYFHISFDPIEKQN